MNTEKVVNLIPADRFWSKVNKNGPIPSCCPERGRCWVWTAGATKSKYGSIQFNHAQYRAHRVAWFFEHGRWPMPMALHHCDNTLCVRPSHLFEGDNTSNMQDAVRKGKFANSDRMHKAHAAHMSNLNQSLMDGMAC